MGTGIKKAIVAMALSIRFYENRYDCGMKCGGLYQTLQADLFQVGLQLFEAGKALEPGDHIKVGVVVHFYVKAVHLVQADLVERIAALAYQNPLRPHDVGFFVLIQKIEMIQCHKKGFYIS